MANARISWFIRFIAASEVMFGYVCVDKKVSCNFMYVVQNEHLVQSDVVFLKKSLFRRGCSPENMGISCVCFIYVRIQPL